MKKIIKIILLTVGVIFVGGCIYSMIKNYEPTPATPATPTSRTLGIYVDEEPTNPQNLKEIKIATVIVAPDGNLTLNILKKDNLQIKQLQQAVEAIASRPGLKLVGESEEIINGQKALVMREFGVSKTDANYIYAVKETLAMEFGFKSEIEK